MKKRTLPAAALALLLSIPLAAWSQGGAGTAVAMAREGQVEEALAAVEAALASDPGNSQALFARGLILAESGRRDAAAEAFRQLIDRHPDLPEGYNNLAVLKAAEGDFDGAVNILKDALATNPSYQTAYENLTRIFAQLASEAYSRALDVESPPARAEVELEMLAVLAAPSPAGAQPSGEVMARMTPAEPIPAPDPAPQVAEEPASEAKVEEEMQADEMGEEVSGETAEMEPQMIAAEPVASEDLETVGLDEADEADEAEVASAEATAASVDDLAGLVESWARAWSEQRVDDYLAFYADEFAPADDMTRQQWESQRRERVAAPEFIKVEVAILDSTGGGDDRATITFLQAYESDTFSDQVTKTLTLVRRGAEWRILEEKSDS